MSELKPCPFCGSACEERAEKGWYACSNNDCPAWHIQAIEEDWNVRAVLAQEADHVEEPLGMVETVQVATMPVERCYDVRVKMIIAFNEAKKAGGDLDDALDAAYKSALRYSPNPLLASPPTPVALVLKEVRALLSTTNYSASRDCHNAQVVGAACDLLDNVKELNQ